MRREVEGSESVFRERYISYFGVSWNIVADAWLLARDWEHAPDTVLPIHLLWALMHLKVYATEPVLASIAGVDKKTFQKWSYSVRFILSEQVGEKGSTVLKLSMLCI